MIVRTHGEVVSLLVDDIGDVVAPGAPTLEPVPVNLPQALRTALCGVIPQPGSILLLLDADRATDVSAATNITGGTP